MRTCVWPCVGSVDPWHPGSQGDGATPLSEALKLQDLAIAKQLLARPELDVSAALVSGVARAGW